MTLAVVGGEVQGQLERESKALVCWLKKQIICYAQASSPLRLFIILSVPWEDCDLRLPVFVALEPKEPTGRVLSWLNWLRGEGYYAFWASSAEQAIQILRGLGY